MGSGNYLQDRWDEEEEREIRYRKRMKREEDWEDENDD